MGSKTKTGPGSTAVYTAKWLFGFAVAFLVLAVVTQAGGLLVFAGLLAVLALPCYLIGTSAQGR